MTSNKLSRKIPPRGFDILPHAVLFSELFQNSVGPLCRLWFFLHRFSSKIAFFYLELLFPMCHGKKLLFSLHFLADEGRRIEAKKERGCRIVVRRKHKWGQARRRGKNKKTAGALFWRLSGAGLSNRRLDLGEKTNPGGDVVFCPIIFTHRWLQFIRRPCVFAVQCVWLCGTIGFFMNFNFTNFFPQTQLFLRFFYPGGGSSHNLRWAKAGLKAGGWKVLGPHLLGCGRKRDFGL